MSVVAPVEAVEAPAPIPRAYRLLEIAGRITEDNPPRFLSGTVQVATPITDIQVTPVQGCPGESSSVFTKAATLDPGAGDVHPGFAVLAGIECSGLSLVDRAGFEGRLRVAFEAVRSAGVELELLTGAATAGPSLVSAASVLNGGTALATVLALAELENEYAAQFGSQPTIHVSPRLAVIMKSKGLLEVPSDRTQGLRTILGSTVIPGAGYAGTDDDPQPGASGAGEEWMYASGPIEYRATEIDPVGDQVAAFLDRETNTSVIFVEQGFNLSWDDQTVLAINVNRTA